MYSQNIVNKIELCKYQITVLLGNNTRIVYYLLELVDTHQMNHF